MTSPDVHLAGSYDFLFVALSVVIAILASYAATRPRRKSNFRAGQGSPFLVERRGCGNGNRHLVDALHRHVGLSLASSGAVRLANSFALAAGCNCRVCRCVVCGEPAPDGSASSLAWQHLDGRRYRRHALHRHGGDAVVRHVPLFYFALHTFDSSRNCDFFRGFMADLLFSDKEEGLELAQGCQRIGDGGWQFPSCTTRAWPRRPLHSQPRHIRIYLTPSTSPLSALSASVLSP